jgi:hypothetical protein
MPEHLIGEENERCSYHHPHYLRACSLDHKGFLDEKAALVAFSF